MDTKQGRHTCSVYLGYDLTPGGVVEETRMFYCYNCRYPVLKYRGHIAMIHPGDPTEDGSPVALGYGYQTFPIQVQCKNGDCRYRYNFVSSVSRPYPEAT